MSPKQDGIFVTGAILLKKYFFLASMIIFFFVMPLSGMGGRVTICGKFERAAGHQCYIFPNSLPASPSHPPTLEKQEQTNKHEN